MMLGQNERLGILMPLQLNHAAAAAAAEMGASSGAVSPALRSKEERVPQWSQQETTVFIAIRGQLERDFTESKRNKNLWEVVVAKMRERGYQRSPDQCKCKWKNLVNRYKGKETSDPDSGKHCPFFDELHAVFTERARNMQQLLESETSTLNHSQKKLKRSSGVKFSDEISDADDGNEESDDEQRLTKNRKMKTDKINKPKAAKNNVHELVQDFFQQQQRAEARWRDLMERMAQERQMFEKEWQQSMEKLERERFMLERAWQEKEELRSIREENRALKRDELLNTLLNKLIQEDL